VFANSEKSNVKQGNVMEDKNPEEQEHLELDRDTVIE